MTDPDPTPTPEEETEDPTVEDTGDDESTETPTGDAGDETTLTVDEDAVVKRAFDGTVVKVREGGTRAFSDFVDLLDGDVYEGMPANDAVRPGALVPADEGGAQEDPQLKYGSLYQTKQYFPVGTQTVDKRSFNDYVLWQYVTSTRKSYDSIKKKYYTEKVYGWSFQDNYGRLGLPAVIKKMGDQGGYWANGKKVNPYA